MNTTEDDGLEDDDELEYPIPPHVVDPEKKRAAYARLVVVLERELARRAEGKKRGES